MLNKDKFRNKSSQEDQVYSEYDKDEELGF